MIDTSIRRDIRVAWPLWATLSARGWSFALPCRGCILTVRVLDSRGNPLPLATLVALMASAIAIADAHALLEGSDAPPVSTLTALGRDEWARERTRLLDDPTSAKSLAAVESALFVVALDHACPATKEEAGQLCLAGSGRDRWHDTSCHDSTRSRAAMVD